MSRTHLDGTHLGGTHLGGAHLDGTHLGVTHLGAPSRPPTFPFKALPGKVGAD